MSFVARFFLLVLVLSISELYLLVVLSAKISLLVTLALCVFTGVLGGAMVRAQGLRTLSEISAQLGQGKLPGEQIVSGLILLIIGTLLLTPGFITDTIAFLMLIPPLRKATAVVLTAYFKKRMVLKSFGSTGFQGGFHSTDDSNATYKASATTSRQGRRNEDIIIEVDAEDP